MSACSKVPSQQRMKCLCQNSSVPSFVYKFKGICIVCTFSNNDCTEQAFVPVVSRFRCLVCIGKTGTLSWSQCEDVALSSLICMLLLQRGGALHYAIAAGKISEEMRDQMITFILANKKTDVNHSSPVSTE